MKKEDVLALRTLSRVFPAYAYAKHSPRVGGPVSNVAAHLIGTPNGGTSYVKILGFLSSIPTAAHSRKQIPQQRAAEAEGEDAVTAGASPAPARRKQAKKETDKAAAKAAATTSAMASHVSSSTLAHHCPRRRSLYVRVQYSKTLIETLPIEIMRERHPQILIDYLLSVSMWA